MEAKELRIGNYVYSNKFVIKSYGVDGFINILKNIDNFTPIPLTEEWLLKFGFEENCNNNYQISYNQVCGLSITISDYKSWFCNLSSTTFYELSNCKHVHQLQNLYFTLTNEELIIK
tara:strand:+ start:605 stop:955 length:351 start_codon:yes stop_codon:yes gene_type:complete